MLLTQKWVSGPSVTNVLDGILMRIRHGDSGFGIYMGWSRFYEVYTLPSIALGMRFWRCFGNFAVA
jgi:hypothetical protein